MNQNISFFLRRGFDLARLGQGSASPNPCVGSVIIQPQQNTIIGEGFHEKYGEGHAEVNAVKSVEEHNKSLLATSKIFVTLEPCFHYGKTPPCVDLILSKKIPTVDIAFTDDNPKVGGKSIEKLRNNNVEVTLYNNNENSFKLGYQKTLLPFFTNIQQQRPYIVLKWAESFDKCIGIEHKQVQISNTFSKRLVHKWRSECDAILVGTNTAATDNPSLDNRFYFGKSPIRIIIDKKNRLSSDLSVFDKSIPTRVYTEGAPSDTDAHPNLTCIHLNSEGSFLNKMLSDMFNNKIGIVLVEGGSKLLQSFIDAGLWDEARVIQSKYIHLKNEKNAIASPIIKGDFSTEQYPLDDNEVIVYRKQY